MDHEPPAAEAPTPHYLFRSLEKGKERRKRKENGWKQYPSRVEPLKSGHFWEPVISGLPIEYKSGRISGVLYILIRSLQSVIFRGCFILYLN